MIQNAIILSAIELSVIILIGIRHNLIMCRNFKRNYTDRHYAERRYAEHDAECRYV